MLNAYFGNPIYRISTPSNAQPLVPADVAEQPCSGIWNARGCAMENLHLISKVCNVGRPTETRRLSSKNLLSGIRTPCNKIPSDQGPPKGVTPKTKQLRKKTTTNGRRRGGGGPTKSSSPGPSGFRATPKCQCHFVGYFEGECRICQNYLT